MLLSRHTTIAVLLSFLFCQAAVVAFGQYGITLDIEKPKEFENRVLQSEKSDQKKFGLTRRFMQNTITHYNYFFNANNKLNEVIERAKAVHKDDYSQLIPFYNYSLDITSADKTELDSISYKAQTGIVLHDLRSDWADNLYLLWGASYYLKKQFDSAYLMFQFINYAFAEKEKDGYYKMIGSARDGNNAFIVSTKEKSGLTQKIFNQPPSRNDAFIWQIRNYLAQDRFSEAGSLIEVLKLDPVFPERLRNDLEEVQAYSFYKQQAWDSAAAHLVNALSNAPGKQEKARWEYLLGQLYESTKKFDRSKEYYEKSISHTTDPIMDVYARLSLVRVNKDDGEDYIRQNIETLVKMARRDKYVDYRDIIYYMAAQMELELNNVDAAIELLLKSTKANVPNSTQRDKAFLQLADLSFAQRRYRQAYAFYDSVRIGNSMIVAKDVERINTRKPVLEKVVSNLDILQRQDSLQRIAALPEEERKAFVKKMARQLRKAQGLKEEGFTSGSIALPVKQEPVSLFATDNKKGEWYFYNNTSRQKGIADFKAKWGTRPNADNWRRSAAIVSIVRTQPGGNGQNLQRTGGQTTPDNGPTEITFDALYERLPLTEEKIKIAEDSIKTALFDLGVLYIQQLEDCLSGTETLEKLRTRFSNYSSMAEVLYHLYFCYSKNGESQKAAEIKKSMTEKFAGNNFTSIVTTGKNPESKGPQQEPTKAYEKIYDLFLEGNFREAIARKKAADSVYGGNYWTPQLLYIESVYYIKQREDSTAKNVLSNIISRFAGTPIADKATTMLDVLNRRAEIEEELRNLVINMPAPDTVSKEQPVVVIPKTIAPAITIPQSKDTVAVKPPVVQKPDIVVAKPPVTPPKDTVVTVKPPVTTPVVTAPPKKDSVIAKPTAVNGYTFEAEKSHYVVVALNKIDPIFVNEAKNAFYRFNRDTYYNKQMNAELVDIDNETRFLLISPFKNAQEAADYVDRTKPRTASEIIPWLRGGRYYFMVITEKNLEVLKASKDIDKYKQFLEQQFPGKF